MLVASALWQACSVPRVEARQFNPNDLPGELQGFDPGAAISSLTAASEGRTAADGPSAGIAGFMRVDPQFGDVTKPPEG